MLAQGARHLEKGMIHHQGHLEYSQLDIDSWGWSLLTGTCGIQIASTLSPSPIAFFLGLIDSLQDLITCLDAKKQCITGEQANKCHKLWLFSRKHAKHLLFKDANKIFFLLFHQALILSDLPLHFLNLHFLRLKSMPNKKNLVAGTQPKAISFCWAWIFTLCERRVFL